MAGSKTKIAKRSFNVAALFAGIGGIEQGLKNAGHKTKLLCECEPGAVAVLETWFRGAPLTRDVRELAELPADIDLLTAGFPCQDLSPAGETKGIEGEKSGLVSHVFRLLERHRVPWVLVENVPFMLQLGRGAAMRYIVGEFERLGYRWSYRVIDSRSFGLPQRRERVFLLASLEADPANVIFADDTGGILEPAPQPGEGEACGFYWTEGNRGLGWAVDAVPTLKGGSTLGIPSPPAIWMPDGRFVTPDITDAERLQGFRVNWTAPAAEVVRASNRWKMVGNAVTVNVAEWIGHKLAAPPTLAKPLAEQIPLPLLPHGTWPRAAYGSSEGRFVVTMSAWPVGTTWTPLIEFLNKAELRPLSHKAAAGFWSRLQRSGLRRPKQFDIDIDAYIKTFETAPMRAISGGTRTR